MLFRIALFHRHLPLVWHWWRGCPQPLGPPGLMCAPSVERGGGENGWADGLTGGALRAGLEPPTKNIRRAAPRAGLGRFHSRAGTEEGGH